MAKKTHVPVCVRPMAQGGIGTKRSWACQNRVWRARTEVPLYQRLQRPFHTACDQSSTLSNRVRPITDPFTLGLTTPIAALTNLCLENGIALDRVACLRPFSERKGEGRSWSEQREMTHWLRIEIGIPF